MRGVRILYAVESLLPARGGAELFASELLELLAGRHTTTAVFLHAGPAGDPPAGVELCAVAAPADGGGYWSTKRRRREAVAAATAALIAERDFDVVASTLHAGPGAVAAARAASLPSVLFLHSYESLCKYAFDHGSACVEPEAGCEDCPAATALPGAERAELLAARRAQHEALGAATELIAPSAAVAAACEAWTGRRPLVAPPVLRDPPQARARRDGHVLLAAARWSPNKGGDLLEPLADALAPRPLAITTAGLEPEPARRLRERGHVRLVPNEPLAELLDGAAALLVPSLWREPFGRIALEGLAAGVPTLATATGGLREFVPAQQLVDPPGDVTRWRDGLDAVLEPGGWEPARIRGRAAADAVRASDPLARIEAVLTRAAYPVDTVPAARRLAV